MAQVHSRRTAAVWRCGVRPMTNAEKIVQHQSDIKILNLVCQSDVGYVLHSKDV